MDRLKSYYLPCVLAVSLIMSFYRLGYLTLFDVDEAVFAEATKEMIQSGDWITPTYNGMVRYDKPIFFYWVMAASYKIFGINEFGARFPSAVSGLLTCLAVFLFVRRISDGKTAFYAFLSLVSSIYFLVYSHAAVTDMMLTLFITLSLFSFFLSETEKDSTSMVKRWYFYGFYLFSALAFLTKGLIGIIFPFGIAVVYQLLAERLSGVRKIFNSRGLVLFFIVAAPWYIAEFAVNGKEFIEQFFIKHHLMRYTDVISGHRGPVYYYILALLVGLFPWVAFLPRVIVKVFTGILEVHLRDGRAGDETDDGKKSRPFSPELRLFVFIWAAFIVLFFSLATTKLPNYILPACPAIVILIASGMSGNGLRANRYSQGFIAAVSLLFGITFFLSKKYLIQTGIPETGWTLIAAAVMMAMAALSVYAALSKKTLYGFMSALMIIFLLILSTTALPIANRYLQGSLHRFSLYARGRLNNDERIIAYRINNPSIVFYSGHEVTNISGVEELSDLMRVKSRLIVISKTKDIDMLEGLGLKLMEQSEKYAILEK